MKRLFIFLMSLSAAMAASSQTYPYQDASLTPEERAKDLLGRLSVEQKVMLMDYDSPEIPEFGIRKYNKHICNNKISFFIFLSNILYLLFLDCL